LMWKALVMPRMAPPISPRSYLQPSVYGVSNNVFGVPVWRLQSRRGRGSEVEKGGAVLMHVVMCSAVRLLRGALIRGQQM
jgi:hypothetical protein